MGEITILIVDDTGINRAVLVNLFENEYDILQAENGQIAWDMLESGSRVDLVLLDLVMPIMDGMTLLERIRSDKRFASLPVIINTQQVDIGIELRALEIGADDFFMQPYNPKLLKNKVKNLADKYILEKRQTQMLLQRTSEKLQALTETIPGGIATFQIGEKYELYCTYYNETINQMLGYTREEFEKNPGRNSMHYIHKNDQKKLIAEIKKAVKNGERAQITVRLLKKDGELLWVNLSAIRMKKEGKYPVLHVIFMDVNEEKKQAQATQEEVEKLRYCQDHDLLTGIFNREKFYSITEQYLHKHSDERMVMTVWDIDHFKVINELFGNTCGDELLKRMASSFQSSIGDVGTYGRLETDHFAACMTQGQLNRFRPQIDEVFLEGIQGDLIDYPVYIHIGVYTIENYDISVKTMCDRAMLALCSIKNNAVVRMAYYTAELENAIFNEQTLAGEMNLALEKHQFFVQLQPVTDAVSGKITSAEALVRWNHPVKGIISPKVFIPIFEKNGFIVKLDRYVWEEVCRIISENRKQGIPVVPVSVNVSRINFYRRDLLTIFQSLVKEYDLTPDYLRIEITESAYSDNPEQLLEIVKKFQQNGFKILMDNFGNGASALTMLKNISADMLKIDMSFMDNIEATDKSVDIVRTIIDMTKRLHIETVAEGVETEGQYELLKNLGCDTIQGYYFSKPLMISDFREYIVENVNAKGIKKDEPELLIIDDQEMIRTQIRLIMEPFYTVMEAEDGKEAYELLEQHAESIKLILTDISMPRMDGYELLDAIHKNAKMNHIPSIVITVSDDADSAIKALAKGAVDVITKPIEPDILLTRAKNVMFVHESKGLQSQMQQLRGDSYAKQNSRRIIESGSNALCRMRILDQGKNVELVYANKLYYEWHNLTENENITVRSMEDVLDNLSSGSKTAVQQIFNDALKRHDAIFQHIFYCIMKDGSRKKILSTSNFSYVNNEIILDVFEVEMFHEEDQINENFSIDFLTKILQMTDQNAWRYDIARDEIEFISNNYYDISREYLLKNAMETVVNGEDFLEEDRPRLRNLFEKIRNGKPLVSDTFYCRKKNHAGKMTNDFWWNRITYVTNYDKNGRAVSAVGISEDVSERIFSAKDKNGSDEYKDILRRDAYLFAKVDLSENVFMEFSCDDMSGALQRGLNAYDDFMKNLLHRSIHPDENSYVKEMLNRRQLIKWFRNGEMESRFDFRMKGNNGEYEWYTSIFYFIRETSKRHIYAVWMIRNVHGEKMRLSHITKLAEHDALTGLYNRTAFEKYVTEACYRNVRENQAAFFMVDIDNFKAINDSFGHDFGDNIIKTVASQILSTFRKEDYVGRIGGDEFSIFLSNFPERQMIETKAKELCDRIKMSFDNSGKDISISCSVGIAFAPEDGISFEQLYVHADEALYRAKNTGKNKYVLYSKESV